MKIYPDDWRPRLITGVLTAICMAVVMILGPVVGIDGFWPGMLAIIVANWLGPVVDRRLFEPSPGDPPHRSHRA